MQVKGCCPLDCQDSCAWVAQVEDGKVIRVEGAKDHPVTRGVLCAKVKDYEQRLTATGRLLHPMRRSGPKGSGQSIGNSSAWAPRRNAVFCRSLISPMNSIQAA